MLGVAFECRICYHIYSYNFVRPLVHCYINGSFQSCHFLFWLVYVISRAHIYCQRRLCARTTAVLSAFNGGKYLCSYTTTYCVLLLNQPRPNQGICMLSMQIFIQLLFQLLSIYKNFASRLVGSGETTFLPPALRQLPELCFTKSHLRQLRNAHYRFWEYHSHHHPVTFPFLIE